MLVRLATIVIAKKGHSNRITNEIPRKLIRIEIVSASALTFNTIFIPNGTKCTESP
jgi:hypothetical protein